MLQLVAIVGSAIATIMTVVYYLGRLEGRVITKLEDHDRRIGVLERRGAPVYERM